jgi:RNA polymerase sigma-70 factor (ECF subfamily)
VDELEHHARELVDVGALLRCLGGLDSRARRVVTLSFNEERPAEEVAGALGTSAGNVRVIRHRAVAALRRCLDASAPGGPNA